jgi:hypothetical protein
MTHQLFFGPFVILAIFVVRGSPLTEGHERDA